MNPQKLIPLDAITISPRNPRKHVSIDDAGIDELAESIQSVGLLHPVLVRKQGKGYELLAGQRRFLACQKAKLTEIAATIANLTDEEALDVMVTENMQRQDLTPLEEGRGVAAMLETRDVATVAGVLGKSISWVRRRAKLATLTESWITVMEGRLGDLGEAMEAALEIRGLMTAGHLELLAHFPPETQDSILHNLRENRWNRQAIAGLARFRGTLDSFTRSLNGIPWPMDSIEFGGSCADCPSRSDREPDLFRGVGEVTDEDEKGGGAPQCLNPECFKEKWAAFVASKVQNAERKTKQSVVTIGESYNAIGPKPDYEPYQVHEAKKGEAGAVPAIRSTGPKAGEMVWVIPPAPKSKDGKGSHRMEAEATLEQRRFCRMCQAIVEWINDRTECPPSLCQAPYMLAAVLCCVTYNEEHEYSADMFKELVEGKDDSAMFAKGWEALKAAMKEELESHTPEYVDVKRETKYLDLALEVLGLEKSDFEAEAEKAIPEEAPAKPAKGKKGASK